MHRLPADILQQPIVLTLSFSLSGQTAEDLLPDTLKQEVAPRPRHARVNTLKTSVEAATAWLQSPPAEHAQHAKQVCNSVIITVEACLEHLHDAESAVVQRLSLGLGQWCRLTGHSGMVCSGMCSYSRPALICTIIPSCQIAASFSR